MNNASVHFFINTDKEERGGEEGLKGVWLGGDWLPPNLPGPVLLLSHAGPPRHCPHVANPVRVTQSRVFKNQLPAMTWRGGGCGVPETLPQLANVTAEGTSPGQPSAVPRVRASSRQAEQSRSAVPRLSCLRRSLGRSVISVIPTGLGSGLSREEPGQLGALKI